MNKLTFCNSNLPLTNSSLNAQEIVILILSNFSERLSLMKLDWLPWIYWLQEELDWKLTKVWLAQLLSVDVCGGLTREVNDVLLYISCSDQIYNSQVDGIYTFCANCRLINKILSVGNLQIFVENLQVIKYHFKISHIFNENDYWTSHSTHCDVLSNISMLQLSKRI